MNLRRLWIRLLMLPLFIGVYRSSYLFACCYLHRCHMFLFQARGKMEWAKTNSLDFLFLFHQSFHLSRWCLNVSSLNISRPVFNSSDGKCLPSATFGADQPASRLRFEKLPYTLNFRPKETILWTLTPYAKELLNITVNGSLLFTWHLRSVGAWHLPQEMQAEPLQLSSEGHRPALQTLTLSDCATLPRDQRSREQGEGSADIGDRWPNSSSTRNKFKKKTAPSVIHTVVIVNSTTVESCQAFIHIPVLQSLCITPERWSQEKLQSIKRV